MIRSAIIFVVVGLLAAGVLYDRVEAPEEQTTTDVETSIVTPSVSDPARLDGAWFCPMGSSADGGFADHEIQVSNLSEEPAVANIGILTGEGKGPTLRVDVAPLSTQRLSLSTIAQADVAGAVVEIIGGTGVVGHRLDTEFGPVEGPCATHVSNSWYFASGRTKLDSKEYLALMNPFPEDVRFNIELFRAAGRPRRPAALQGGVIAASSVRIIEIGEHVRREEAVAATITTVRGRLVVERLQTLNGEFGPSGAALQLGATAPAESWMLPAGRIQEGGDDRVIVFNPSSDEVAMANIELWPVNPTDRSLYGLGPIPRELLPGRFEIIDLRIEADRFGLRLPFEVGVSVTSENGVPILAERWQFATEVDTTVPGAGEDPTAADEEAPADGEAPAEGEEGIDGEAPVPGELDVPGIFGGEAAELAQPSATEGIATSRGTEVLSDRWIIPWVSIADDDSTVVIVTSPQEASVKVFALFNGELVGPFRASLAAGGRAIIPISLAGDGAPILVTSDAPVSVEAQVVALGSGMAVVPGIPTVGP